MRYVFFGTPEFAATVLKKLIGAEISPLVIVANPDRPVGRKKIVTPPPTKVLGNEYGIPVLQPEKLDEDFIGRLAALKPEFLIIAVYAKIIPKRILDLAPRGAIGVHPSLLPAYRGPSPIQSAILNDEEETGITLFLLDEEVDHGPILAKRAMAVEGRMHLDVLRKLAEIAGDLLVEALPRFSMNELMPQPQDHTKATFTKKFSTKDGFVSEEDLREAENGDEAKAKRIANVIRALNPEPGAWTTKNGKRLKLLAAKTEDRKLILTRIQYEGKKPQELAG